MSLLPPPCWNAPNAWRARPIKTWQQDCYDASTEIGDLSACFNDGEDDAYEAAECEETWEACVEEYFPGLAAAAYPNGSLSTPDIGYNDCIADAAAALDACQDAIDPEASPEDQSAALAACAAVYCETTSTTCDAIRHGALIDNSLSTAWAACDLDRAICKVEAWESDMGDAFATCLADYRDCISPVIESEMTDFAGELEEARSATAATCDELTSPGTTYLNTYPYRCSERAACFNDYQECVLGAAVDAHLENGSWPADLRPLLGLRLARASHDAVEAACECDNTTDERGEPSPGFGGLIFAESPDIPAYYRQWLYDELGPIYDCDSYPEELYYDCVFLVDEEVYFYTWEQQIDFSLGYSGNLCDGTDVEEWMQAIYDACASVYPPAASDGGQQWLDCEAAYYACLADEGTDCLPTRETCLEGLTDPEGCTMTAVGGSGPTCRALAVELRNSVGSHYYGIQFEEEIRMTPTSHG